MLVLLTWLPLWLEATEALLVLLAWLVLRLELPVEATLVEVAGRRNWLTKAGLAKTIACVVHAVCATCIISAVTVGARCRACGLGGSAGSLSVLRAKALDIVGAVEGGLVEVGLAEIRGSLTEVYGFFAAGAVRAAEARCLGGIRSAEGRSTEIGLAKVRLAKIRVSKIGVAEVGITEGRGAHRVLSSVLWILVGVVFSELVWVGHMRDVPFNLLSTHKRNYNTLHDSAAQ